jgi:hypothetical protein
MLGAFFDDSGIHSSSEAVVLGGLLGTERHWDVFAAAWASALAEPSPGRPTLKQFHLSPCRARSGDFRDYGWGEIDAITYKFRRIILDVDLVTIACAVDRIAWSELLIDEIAEQLGEPEQLCFHKCMEAMLNTIRFRKPGEQVDVYFDQGVRRQLRDYASFYVHPMNRRPEISRLVFADVEKVVPLQGADVIAFETYSYEIECIKNPENPVPNPHFREYVDRDLSMGRTMGRDQIAEVAARVRQTILQQDELK